MNLLSDQNQFIEIHFLTRSKRRCLLVWYIEKAIGFPFNGSIKFSPKAFGERAIRTTRDIVKIRITPKVPIGQTSRLRALLSVYEFRSRCDARRIKSRSRTNAERHEWGSQLQPTRGREYFLQEEEERKRERFLFSNAFVQGEFVDNVPRLPARIINHLFPMNWRTVKAGRFQGTLILRRVKTISTQLSRDIRKMRTGIF